MGMVCGVEGDPMARQKSTTIDDELRKAKQQLNQESRILLLGPGESGKSTIFKQMKIIQDNGGFTKEELMGFKHVVHANCISQMRVLVQAAARQRQPFQNQQNVQYAAYLLQLPAAGNLWSTDIALMIKALWLDNGIRSVYGMAGTLYQLNDTASYFFDSIDRFLTPDYTPTVDDVLRVRVRSTGIEEAMFVFDKMVFKVMDVGGQRSERRKWIHCFDGVTAILYCAALSSYDQVLREEGSVNRLTESLHLFEDVVNSPFFSRVAVILFLNKTDLFREKLRRGVPLNALFPNYTGGQDYDNALAFIDARFRERVNDQHDYYVHFTCAVDTKNIEYVIKDVRVAIMKLAIDFNPAK
jgi:guanine nucleotide-binding protein subunit alpha